MGEEFVSGLVKAKIKKTDEDDQPSPDMLMYPRQESNLDLKFRKLLFYPLNYGGRKAQSYYL